MPPIVIIHADDGDGCDDGGDDVGGLIECDSVEVLKSRFMRPMIKTMIKKMRHQSYANQPHLWLI